jgi:hypothetical protein
MINNEFSKFFNASKEKITLKILVVEELSIS